MEKPLEIMRVIRIPPRGELVVQVGEKRYARLAEVDDQRLRNLLEAAIGELIVFADGYEALIRAGVAPPLAADVESDAPAAPDSMEARRQAFLRSLEQEGPAEPSARPAAPSSAPSGLSALWRREPQVDEPPTLDLVAQIDAVLQRHLAQNEQLSQRQIRLEEDPRGGLRIRVGATAYRRPEDIPEPAVRQVIQQALKEWESG
ncbi:MAG: hypothetical protein R3300_07810 [Candidatus Promineifilaceae bacterium]|nr:hypothetical protein [Candidatus Promineifilaceae bacterium]